MAVLLSAALLLIIGSSSPFQSTAADEASTAWIVAELTGAAYARPGAVENAPWRKLAAGTRIELGSVVRTDPLGQVTLFNGSDRIQLAANSEIELPAAVGDDGFTRVIHWIGSAFFQVGKRPEPHFEVDTPYLVAVVKGTKFATVVSDEGASVDVTEGVVGVSAGEGAESRDLTAGQSANVSASATDKVAPGKAIQGKAPPADDGNPTASGKGNAPGGADNPGNAGGNDKGNEKGNGSVNGNGGSKGNGNGNGGGNGNGNGGANGNGCHGNAGCHHDANDKQPAQNLKRDAKK